MKYLPALFSLSFFAACHGAKILALMSVPSPSHGIVFERLLRELSKKGHSITYLTSVGTTKNLGNVKVLEVPNFMEEILKQGNFNTTMNFRIGHPILFYLLFPNMGILTSKKVLECEVTQSLIKSNEKFDLIIADNFLQESLAAGFSYKYNATLITLHAFMPNVWANFLVGNPAPSSFVSEPWVGFGTDMPFFERVINFIACSAIELFHIHVYLPQQAALMKEYFGNDSPPMTDVLKNTSLVLVNHHYNIGYPRPNLPNIIEVGGLQIDELKPLPAGLQKYLDDSKDGVIYFSLGSNLKSADLPKELRQQILNAFSRIKLNVLWKFETEIDNLPANVRVMKWCPQSDILAHPNVKLFITHGGLLSTTEAMTRGVPVVGIPFFGDQPLNIKLVEKQGLGKGLLFEEITETTFYNAIYEVLSNPSYKENAAKKSMLLKDLQKPPLETAMWWIEYVIRHKGAKHLRSASQDLEWYQLYLLDVLLFIASILIVTLIVATSIFNIILKKLFCKKSDQRSKNISSKKIN